VSVRINSTVLTNVPKGGLFSFTRDFTLESGSVSYADYTGGTPYIHKITPKGNAHHVIEAEILSPRRKNDPRGPGADRPGATIVVDNYRLRAARLSVEPDKSASIAPNGNTFVVVVKGGQAKGLRTGDVEWYGEPSARSVRNDGSSAVELVEIHVK
jgi:hypothetical protein